MRIKSYFADSVQEAMELARLELGPEAMLVNSRKTDPELRHLGAYEVVFGMTSQSAEPRSQKGAGGRQGREHLALEKNRGQQDALLEEMAELRRQIESVKRSVSRQSAHLRLTGLERWPELEQLYEQLLGAGFSPEIGQELVQALAGRFSEEKSRAGRGYGFESGLQQAVREEIERRLQTAPQLAERAGRTIVLFVGPAGSGKTSLLVKLAIRYGIGRGLPVQIVSADTLRVGAAEQLSTYARILGAGFEVVHTPAAVCAALEEHRAKKLLLIDTPGYAPGEMDEAAELAAAVERQAGVEVQLVLPATWRQNALAQAFERFRIFHPAKLVFTHWDESERPGAALDQAMRAGIPISFVSCGQRIPEDLREASPDLLLENLWEQLEVAAVSAA
jgi:flagellar biosynthesis protein FlhF